MHAFIFYIFNTLIFFHYRTSTAQDSIQTKGPETKTRKATLSLENWHSHTGVSQDRKTNEDQGFGQVASIKTI